MVLPYSVEAEEALLGSILIRSEALDDIQEIVKNSDFYRASDRIVYDAMLALTKAGRQIDLVTLTDAMDKSKTLEKAGGIAFITSLANKVPTSLNAKFYAEIVKEKAIRRRLLRAADELKYYAGSEDSIAVVADKAEKAVSEAFSADVTPDICDMRETMLEVCTNLEIRHDKGSIMGLTTGFSELDKILCGLQNSDFIIIAARPAMGKTAFALNIARHLAIKNHIPVGFFSLEMSKAQLAERLLSAASLVDSLSLRSGEIADSDWERLLAVSDQIAAAPLFIADDAAVNVMRLRSMARKLKRTKGIKLIIIDYLQLMQSSAKGENRQNEIAEISRSLKILARELDLPIIALSQLSRSVEMRQDKRPMLSDLRESGSLEQDADVVMFLYREDYYLPDTDNKNLTELIIAKQRRGPTGTVNLFFHKAYTQFQDLIRG